jgi:TPR repeat protein
MKISRYYFEKAASKNFGKAMVRMYDILKDKEPNQAMNYLNKACEKPSDGEELFKLSIVYEQGLHGVIKDKVKSRKLLDQSAKLNYPEAIKKVTMS